MSGVMHFWKLPRKSATFLAVFLALQNKPHHRWGRQLRGGLISSFKDQDTEDWEWDTADNAKCQRSLTDGHLIQGMTGGHEKKQVKL